jgi:chitinase
VLHGSGGAFNSNLQANIKALQDAGKNVLISFGGAAGVPSSAYESYAQNVDGLVEQLVSFVTGNGFSGVDTDVEDDAGFTGAYDGVRFLIALTNGLAQALPAGQDIITHAPQTPYWDPAYNNAPYADIWQGAGNQITWINNQVYNNMISQVIMPLQDAWGAEFGGVMGWEFARDQGGMWAQGIWSGLTGAEDVT